MGKVVGTIAKVAAVVAIAYFAPQVAAKVGAAAFGKAAAAKVAASTLGSTVASAATGAAMGEAGGAVGLGTDWKTGALAGGYGGFSAAKAAAASAAATPAATGATGATGVGGISTGTTLTAGSGASVGSGVTGLSGALTGGAGTAATGLPAGLGAGGTSLATGMGATGLGAGLSAAAPAAATGLGGMLAAAPAGLKKAAPSLIAAGLVGTGMSAQMKAQQAELDKARQANAAFTQERFSQAQRLLGEADYFNPEYMGRQAGQAALVRGSIQEGEATRGLTGARLAAEQRRFRLGTARNVGTAFQQGFGQGVTGRIQTRQAGIGAIPAQYPTTTEAGLRLDEAQLERRNAERKGIGMLLGDVFGVPPVTAPLEAAG